MFLIKIIISSAIICLSVLNGQTVIQGDLCSFSPLTSDKNPYIVPNQVTISSGKEVVINEGCILLFEDFTGINVYGSLIVNGTTSLPVIFTSINDSVHNRDAKSGANLFDWNGIVIDQSASVVKFKNIKLSYSVYGVKTHKKDILVENAVFSQNGQFNFTINDQIQLVRESNPFSYSLNITADTPKIILHQKNTQEMIFEKKITEKPGKKAGITALIIAPVLFSGGCLTLKNALNHYDNADRIRGRYTQTINTDESTLLMQKYEQEVTSGNVNRNVTILFGILCAFSTYAGFTFCF